MRLGAGVSAPGSGRGLGWLLGGLAGQVLYGPAAAGIAERNGKVSEMVLLDMQVMESATAAEQGPAFGASTEPTSDASLLLCQPGDGD